MRFRFEVALFWGHIQDRLQCWRTIDEVLGSGVLEPTVRFETR